MTEEEWVACDDPDPMLDFLRAIISERKVRLFAAGCCRHIWHLLQGQSQKDVEISELLADEVIDLSAVMGNNVRRLTFQPRFGETMDPVLIGELAAWWMVGDYGILRDSPTFFRARNSSSWAVEAIAPLLREGTTELRNRECACQSNLLRDIVGNPFRTVSINRAWLAWNNSTVVHLAQAIYDERAFDRMRILADALEDAGCHDGNILEHCRGPGPHVRGCWVVDMLLGKP